MRCVAYMSELLYTFYEDYISIYLEKQIVSENKMIWKVMHLTYLQDDKKSAIRLYQFKHLYQNSL